MAAPIEWVLWWKDELLSVIDDICDAWADLWGTRK